MTFGWYDFLLSFFNDFNPIMKTQTFEIHSKNNSFGKFFDFRWIDERLRKSSKNVTKNLKKSLKIVKMFPTFWDFYFYSHFHRFWLLQIGSTVHPESKKVCHKNGFEKTTAKYTFKNRKSMLSKSKNIAKRCGCCSKSHFPHIRNKIKQLP